MKKFTEADILLQAHLRGCGYEFNAEQQILDARRWRVDYMFWSPLHTGPVAIEIDGGQYGRGHKRGYISPADRKRGHIKTALERDNDKMNTLATMRIPVLHFTPQQIQRGEDIPFLRCFASLEPMAMASDGLPALLDCTVGVSQAGERE